MYLDYGVIGENSEGKMIKALFIRGQVGIRELGVWAPLRYDKDRDFTIYEDYTGWILNRDRSKNDFCQFYEAVKKNEKIVISNRAAYYCEWLIEKIEQEREEKRAAAEKAFREAQERAAEKARMLDPEYRIAHTECPGNCAECYFFTKGYGTEVTFCRYLNDIYKKRGYDGIAPCDWHGRPILSYLVTHEAIIAEERPEDCPYLRKEVAV